MHTHTHMHTHTCTHKDTNAHTVHTRQRSHETQANRLNYDKHAIVGETTEAHKGMHLDCTLARTCTHTHTHIWVTHKSLPFMAQHTHIHTHSLQQSKQKGMEVSRLSM